MRDVCFMMATGRLTKKPTSHDGGRTARFTIVCNKINNDDEPNLVDCAASDEMGRVILESDLYEKGRRVLVRGDVAQRWEEKNGRKNTHWTLWLDCLPEFLDFESVPNADLNRRGDCPNATVKDNRISRVEKTSDLPDVLTVDDLARILPQSRRVLWERIRKGEISGFKIGRRVFVRREVIEKLISGGNG